MYQVERTDFMPKNLFAGEFPIATAVEKVKISTPITEHTLVALKDTGIEAASATNIADLYGITATAAEGGKEVVVYLTGEFKTSSITFPAGAEPAKVKTALRKLNIFLK